MESSEFDATLGGSAVLPHTANTLKFAASRSIEIAAMTESILRPSKTKLIFQTLPVHMRRRVMSHNCKRLPQRLREGHMEQLKKSGLPPQQKRPTRKYRRRPANLLDEYTRRQRKNVWLETHIWHAKRFHMIEKWGHRLAYRPCDKAFRACYRASSAHCLMQDISFYTTIQIKGPINIIRDMFNSITSNAIGLGIHAKAFISGNREGSINLFKHNEYPFGYIGKVSFIWTSNELWLFVHPSYAKQVESTLTEIKNGTNSTSDCDDNAKRRKLNNVFSEIQITIILGLNRFRLTGPKSHAVLTRTLKCVNDLANIEQKEWVSHAINESYDLNLVTKNDYWSSLKSINSPAQLPPKIVIGLIVKDPRLSRPTKRIKAKLERVESISTETLINIPMSISYSPLWDVTVRDLIKNNRVTNAQFIKHVTNTQLVPGELNEDDPRLQPIPIVLIQRPGSQNSKYKKIGYCNGWDIIIPPGYGLPFWLTFIMFGGRSGGLRETENLAFEMGENHISPDSETGALEEKAIEIKLRENYFKKPPSKRVNFIKLAQPSPFICPWKVLIKDWGGAKEERFFILRDKNLINEIQECIKKKIFPPEIENKSMCLVAIYLQIVGKGNLQNHANICIPQLGDLKSNTVIEPHHDDCNAKARKDMKVQNRKLLKQLRRRRIKSKKKAEIMKVSLVKKKKTSKGPSEYVQGMRELWLPSNVDTVRNSGIRETMGYVVHGGFSFTEAKSCGVGYVTLNSLLTLVSGGLNQVLVRNTTSRMYRLANFELIKY